MVAPDSFKGTYSAPEVASAIASGLAAAGHRPELCPLADGGEGTRVVVGEALGARFVEVTVRDAFGRPVAAKIAVTDGAVGVVEAAEAVGFARLAADERDPWMAGTEGVGDLIAATVEAGAAEVLVGLGGSVTVDGGFGAIDALVKRFGERVPARVKVLCDVTTPWERCAMMYGEQKGATQAELSALAQRLEVRAPALRRDPRGIPLTGAAGGLSGGLWGQFGAELVCGADLVADVVELRGRLGEADAVVVGEGRLDRQTAEGKVIRTVSTLAAETGTPVHAIVGSAALDPSQVSELGLASVRVASELTEIEAAADALGIALTRPPDHLMEAGVDR